MIPDKVLTDIRQMKAGAIGELAFYASLHGTHVDTKDLMSICAVLGEISLEEAKAAIDRLEREATS
jgi:hypothetical protein